MTLRFSRRSARSISPRNDSNKKTVAEDILCDRFFAPQCAAPLDQGGGRMLEHRRYSDSHVGSDHALRLLLRLPSFPVTGSLHEKQTPVYTAAGGCAGFAPASSYHGGRRAGAHDAIHHIVFLCPHGSVAPGQAATSPGPFGQKGNMQSLHIRTAGQRGLHVAYFSFTGISTVFRSSE